MTERLDRIATHPLWGFLLLFSILGVVFWLTYALGTGLQEWLDLKLVGGGAAWVRAALRGAPPWLIGLLAQGVVGGAGLIVTLLPILLLFFTAMALLEDVGYLPRAARLMDRVMRSIGLHGGSALVLAMGFGCNVPAVLAARTIEAPRARLLTILLAPLVPCPARMAVLTILAPIFFGPRAAVVIWGLVGLSLAVLMLLGAAMHKALGGPRPAFIMEPPLYHRPNWRTIGLSVWHRTVPFAKNAGGIIVVIAVIVWTLSTLPAGQMETSYLASFGRLAEPVGGLLGLNWQMTVALLTSIIAKENAIATLGVLYGASEEGRGLAEVMHGVLPPAAALAFLAVQMLFIPCAATAVAVRRETGSWRWMLFDVVLLLLLSLAAGIALYQGARLLAWGV